MNETSTGNQVPALEKGLDVIEALAAERGSLLQKEVAARVGRSVSEIFRVLNALEARGYVSRDPLTGSYSLTLRLFELAHIHPPTRRLIEVATSEMERLSSVIGCSCHLVAPHQNKLMVVAQAQPDTLLMGWTVKVGAAFPMSQQYPSARVIAAHQNTERQALMVTAMLQQNPGLERDEILFKLQQLKSKGYEVSASVIAPGVTDISFPILNHLGDAVAAITVPKVSSMPQPAPDLDEIVAATRGAARAVSSAIGGGRIA